MRKRSRLGPLSRLPRKSGVRRFKSLVSWDCRIFWRYITRRLYTRSNLRHLQQWGVRYKEVVAKRKPERASLLSSIEMQELTTFTSSLRQLSKLFASIVEENFTISKYSFVDRDVDDDENDLLFFFFFSFSFPR